MFDLRLYDRETHLQHQNNQEDGPNIWIINSYTRTKQDFSNDQIHGNANLYKLRMGTDLYNEVSDKGEQQLFGIMAARRLQPVSPTVIPKVLSMDFY